MYGVCGAHGLALAAQLAFLEINIREVVGDGDGLVGADLKALAATDTCRLALLHGHSALLLVRAGDIDPHAARTFVAQLDNLTGASLDTRTATDAHILDDLGQTCLEIHLHGTVGTSLNTVAASEASVGAGALAGAERCEHRTRGGTLETGQRGAQVACAVTLDDGYLRFCLGGGQADNLTDLFHYGTTRRGARQRVERCGVDTGHRKVAASAASASAAVRAGQQGLDLVNAGVFVDMELLGHDVEYSRADDADNPEDND